MRFTAIATLLMVAVTIAVTPALRMDLLRLLGGAVETQDETQAESQTRTGAGDTGQRLAEIPRQVLDSLPVASRAGADARPAEPAQRRMALDLNALAPAAGPDSGADAAGSLQVAALPPVSDPLHDSEIFRLSDLAPAAPPTPAPATDFRAGVDPQVVDPQGVALFVAIGSFDTLREAATLVRRHADWDPMIHRAKMNERMRHVVVLGPFESGDVGAVLKRLRETGIAEPWPLAVQLRPGLEVKGLELLG